MDKDKIIGFEDFCSEIQNKLFDYMSEKYSVQNFEVVFIDEKDLYGHISKWFYINDKKHSFKDSPKFSLDGAYENLKKIGGDVEKILKVIAVSYEKAYENKLKEDYAKYDNRIEGFDVHNLFFETCDIATAEKELAAGFYVLEGEGTCFEFLVKDSASEEGYFKLTDDMIAACEISPEELLEIAKKNLSELLTYKIEKIPGDVDLEVGDIWIVSTAGHYDSMIYHDGVFDKLAESQSALFASKVDQSSYIALNIASVSDYKECKEVLNELRMFTDGVPLKLQLYDKENHKFIIDEKEIEEKLKEKESKNRKSVFRK